jgi:hypothetical protein
LEIIGLLTPALSSLRGREGEKFKIEHYPFVLRIDILYEKITLRIRFIYPRAAAGQLFSPMKGSESL